MVLLDPSWNPADDIQAMGRIYRQGQTRSTTIYRMFTSGTMEEVMYQRQLTKNALASGVLDPRNGNGNVSPNEINDCLTLKLGCDCDTRRKAFGKYWPDYMGADSLRQQECSDGPLVDVAESHGHVLGFVHIVVEPSPTETDGRLDDMEGSAGIGLYESDGEEEFEFDMKLPGKHTIVTEKAALSAFDDSSVSSSASEFELE